MKLLVRYQRAGADTAQLQISVDSTARVADVAARLMRSDPQAPHFDPAGTFTLATSEPGSSDLARTLDPDETIHEAGVKSGATVSVVPVSGQFVRAGAGRGPVAAQLHVLSGPDAGRRFDLPIGSTLVGRAGEADITLTDPLVSKRHCRITVTDRIEIVDLNSANGIMAGNTAVTRAAVQSGDEFVLGQTLVAIVSLRALPTAVTAGPSIEFNRSPRVVPLPEDVELASPDLPMKPGSKRFPFIASMAPLIMGVVMFLVTKSILSIIFIALSPVVIVGNYIDTKITARREYRDDIARFTQALAQAREDAVAAQQRERWVLEERHPAVSRIAEAVSRFEPLLWTRRPEHDTFLTVRLGTGTRPSTVTFSEILSRTETEHSQQRMQLVSDMAMLTDAPLTADLTVSGALGICGDLEHSATVAQSVVFQLAGLHSPAEIVLVVMASPRSRDVWEWVEWLPHANSPHSPLPGDHVADNGSGCAMLLAQLEEVVSARVAAGRTASGDGRVPNLPAVVVVVEHDAAVDRGRLIRVAETGPDVGIYTVWRSAVVSQLPSVCRVFVDCAPRQAGVAAVGSVQVGRTTTPVHTDGIPLAECQRLAMTMAPVIDIGAALDDSSDIPRTAGILTLEGGSGLTNPAMIAERWEENGSLVSRRRHTADRPSSPGDLRALVGMGAEGEFYLDLRTQGPHALVGGTTGAGKSEFLQAWILGMAAAHSPERVTFLFVDYKGGSAFAQCVALPHKVGLVTDLSPHLVRRALTSLKAELHYREELFNSFGAKDLPQMEAEHPLDAPPSLIIVIDEFAALAKEVPAFVDGVIDVAQRGRSLGLHLIMATQRPAGVINDNLRANTNLRIALRMADVSDSQDVLGDKMAGFFDPGIPGRAAAKTGPGRITLFQSAFAGGVSSDQRRPPEIEIALRSFGTKERWKQPAAAQLAPADGPKDISRIVDAIGIAARDSGAREPRLPWRDVLPDHIELADPGLLSGTDAALLLGIADDPQHQKQRPVYFEPDVDGNIAIYGTGGSGKSTALRTIATAAAYTPKGGPVRIYGVDFGSGGLAQLEPLRHVGSIISGDDTERISRLIRQMRDVVDERTTRYSTVNAGTITEYRTQSGHDDEFRVLILIDGFGTFRQEYDSVSGRGHIYTAFQQLLTDGRGVGVHCLLTADRPMAIPTSITSNISRRIILRQVDEDGYRALGVPRDVVDAESPPGRGIDATSQLELQIAVRGGTSSLVEQARLLESLAKRQAESGGPAAPAIERLPEIIVTTSLPDNAAGLPVLGVADDDLAPVGFEPRGTFMISGPAQSGRSTAVRTMAAAVAAARPGSALVYFGSRRSPATDLDFWTEAVTQSDDAATLARSLLEHLTVDADEGPLVCLFVEGIGEMVGTSMEQPLAEAIKQAKRHGHFVVAESENAAWMSTWPLITEVRNGRRGIALQTDHIDGEALYRTPFPRVQRAELPVGRGTLVQAGRTRRIQMPTPP